jgi:ubiquinol-cytochrome c reductase iron-sulfur subunit
MNDIIIKDEKNEEGVTRRDFVVLTAGAMACVGAAVCAWPLIDSLNPSADVLSLGTIEVDISDIKEGHEKTVTWRGKPVFIRHRTTKEIQDAKNVNLAELRDPQTDDQRVQKGHEQWLITIGVCTHLGCVPIGAKGEYGGWLCPCHGSDYDTSGRIRKGPAPENLHIPDYQFLSDTKVRIG